MRIIKVELDKLDKTVLNIGWEGEQNHVQVQIQCGAFFAKYPNAGAGLTVLSPANVTYPVVLGKEGNDLIWDIDASDVVNAGSGKIQLTFTDGTGDDAEVIKTVIGSFNVNASLAVDGTAPDPIQHWIDQAEQTARQIAEESAIYAKEEIVESYGSIAPAIIETASGEIASISDGADGMLVKKLTVDIDPVQDLHGYDYPWPAGGGKNLCEFGDQAFTQEKVITLTKDIPAGTYMLSALVTSDITSGSCNIVFIDTSNNTISRYITPNTGSRTAVGSAIEATNPIHQIILRSAGNYSQSAGLSATFKDIQIESGSTATAYAPYSNICPISGWTEANVSRTGKNLLGLSFESPKTSGGVEYTLNADGSITCVGTTTGTSWGPGNSETVLLKAGTYKINLAGATNIRAVMVNASSVPERTITTNGGVFTLEKDTLVYAYIRSLTGDSGVVINETIYMQLEIGSTTTEYEKYHGSTTEYEFPSEAAGTVYGGTLTIHQDGTGELVVDRENIASYNGETLPGRWISDRDVYAQGSTPTTGAQVVYELATPVTYQLTNQQVIALLKGSNNVWADTGDVALEYPADTKLYIDGKVAELQALILENISNS